MIATKTRDGISSDPNRPIRVSGRRVLRECRASWPSNIHIPGLSASQVDEPAVRKQFQAPEAEGTNGQDSRIRVLSVDDHPLLREGIAAIINNQSDMALIAGASSGTEGIQKFREHQPDVTLMDLRLPDLSGIDAVIAIRSQFPEARIIMLSTFDGDVDIQRALKAGAYGYLLKSTPRRELIEAIRKVHSGKKSVPAEVAANLAEHLSGEGLTDREMDVLRHIAHGGRNKDIADRLFIAEETVKVHVKHIMEKLGANDRTEAMVIAVRRGIIRL
jgi:DNA-binding NarL/FixJ family response regulator